MNNYTPFLKLKSNEIMAFKELEASLKVACVPFFDIPKDDQLSEDEFKIIENFKKSNNLKTNDEALRQILKALK